MTDSHGYIDYAGWLSAGTIKSGQALLREAAVPVTLFRLGGYPAVIAGLQAVFGQAWLTGLIGLQIAAQAAVAGMAYRAGLALALTRRQATVVALLPAFGFVLVLQLCVLTDSLYAALLSSAALLLVAKPNMVAVAMAAVMLAAATAMREATMFLAIGYLPLAILAAGQAWRRRVAAVALVIGLVWAVVAGQVGWNVSRGVGYVMTTSPQTVLVQAVLPLVKAGYPVFDGSDAFDQAARETLASGEYDAIDTLHHRLFAEGMSATEMARAASDRYWRTWRRFPLAMSATAIANFRPRYLAMPLQPLETLSDLAVFAGESRPRFAQLNQEWRMLRQGDLSAAIWVVLDAVTRGIGIGISLAAIVGPWRRGATPRSRALWCVCAGLVAVYLPVHVEPRYLAPLTPLVCLLAMTSRFSRR